MPRPPRVDVGGCVYHILNRANAGKQIFDSKGDYLQFESILEEAIKKYSMRLLAYCVMPNHWHLVLYPLEDGELRKFMSWLTSTHTIRWHLAKDTVGQGHIYQGRYKSFIVQTDAYLLNLIMYVERNAKRANLVERAEDWRWSSVWRREYGSEKQRKYLSEWPIEMPDEYISFLNEAQTEDEEEAIRKSVRKGNPYGDGVWMMKTIKKYGLESTLRKVGRPKNGV